MDVTLLLIAGLGAAALVVGVVARRLVPEIVVFLALGVAIGPDGLGLINDANARPLNLLTQVALGLIIFLIGDRLRLESLVEQRRVLIPLNVAQILLAGLLTFFAVRWVGADLQTAFILAVIATESGVLTVSAVVTAERAHGRFTDLLMSSLGITNAATAILFGLTYPFVLASLGGASSAGDTALLFLRLVVLSTVIGALGAAAIRAGARFAETSGELLLVVLLAIMGVVGGAMAARGSVVLSTLLAGIVLANRAPWLSDRVFASVRILQSPLYLVFFVVAGAEIHLDELRAVGPLGIAYVIARASGKVLGGAVGGALVRAPRRGAMVGAALLPHAGMAIALAALVVETAAGQGATVSTVVLGSIVVFELAGPFVLRRTLSAVGEAGEQQHGHAVEVVPRFIPERRFSKVLVPVGGVDIILPRLPFLLDLVGTMGAELVVLHVGVPGAALDEDVPDVLQVVREVAEDRGVECTTLHTRQEAVASAIVEVAARQSVDLIVMGQPVRTSTLERSGRGSITRDVAEAVDVPVLTYSVHPDHPDRVPPAYARRLRGAATGAGRDVAPDDVAPDDEAQARG